MSAANSNCYHIAAKAFRNCKIKSSPESIG
jgi:hypothetical protein